MVEVTTISEAKAFAEELKKALATTDKNVTVNINLNVGERARKPEIPVRRVRPTIRRVDKETGKSVGTAKPYKGKTTTTTTITTNPPWNTNVKFPSSMSVSGTGDSTITIKGETPDSSNHTCKCENKHVYRPDVNRRNACRRRAARRFEQKRKEMLRNGIADCKITQCPHSSTPKTFHKKFVDENGNMVSVNYTYNDNPSPEDIARMYRKMNQILRDFPFVF